MGKEWSTFADGEDCRDCISCEKEIVKLNNKISELNEIAMKHYENSNNKNHEIKDLKHKLAFACGYISTQTGMTNKTLQEIYDWLDFHVKNQPSAQDEEE